MVIQIYKQKSEVLPINDLKGNDTTYFQLKNALADVDLMIGGTPLKPQILNVDTYTGETLSPEAFEDRIADLYLNISMDDKYSKFNLNQKLEARFGPEFMEVISNDYKDVLDEREQLTQQYVSAGLAEQQEYVNEEPIYLGENEKGTKVGGTVFTPTGYTETVLTENGEKYLFENPNKNPEIRNIVDYGHTPLDDKRHGKYKKIGAVVAGVAFGGAVAAGLAGENQESTSEDSQVQRSSITPWSDGNQSRGVVHSYAWDYRGNDNPNDDSTILTIAWDIPQQGSPSFKTYNIANGSNGVSSQDLIEALDWQAYPFENYPNVLDRSGAVAIEDGAVTFLGPYTQHTVYQAQHDGTPTVTNLTTVDGNQTITKDGQPVYEKGIDFDLVLPGRGPAHNWMENSANYQDSLNETVALGVESIHVKAPQNLEDGMQFLDLAYEAGLDVYVDLSMPWNEDNQSTQDRAQRVVDAYKNHSAVAGWDLGEYSSSDGFINDTLAPLVKSLDSNHLVSAKTSEANLASADQDLSNVDVLDVRSQEAVDFAGLWPQLAAASHPIVLTHGASAYDVAAGGANETKQAQYLGSQLEDIINNTNHYTHNTNGVVGNFIDGWSDQLWVTGQQSLSRERAVLGDSVQNNISSEHTGLQSWSYDIQTGNWVKSGKEATTTLAVAFDSIAPEVYFENDTTPEGLINQDHIFLNVTGKDNALIKSVSASLDGPTGFSVGASAVDPSKVINLQHTVTDLADGPYTAEASAEDEAGLQNQTTVRNYIVDTTPAQIQVQADTTQPGLHNVSYIIANATTSDLNGVNQTSLKVVDNVTGRVVAEQVFSGENANANVSVPNGQYRIEFEAVDNAGNPSNDTVYGIGIDATHPWASIEDGSSRGLHNSTNVVVNASAVDQGAGLDQIIASLKDRATNQVVASQTGNASFTANLIAPQDGDYEIEVLARDLAGNWAVPAIDYVTVDTTPANASYENDTVRSGLQSGSTAKVNVSAQDVNGIEDIIAKLYDNVTKELVDQQSTPAEFTGLEEKEYFANATVIDKAGNRVDLPPIYFTKDQTAPNVAFGTQTPEDGTNLTQDYIEADASATDLNGVVELALQLRNATTNQLIAENVSQDGNVSANYTGLPNDDYRLVVVGRDPVDNKAELSRVLTVYVPGNNNTSNNTGGDNNTTQANDTIAPELWFGPNTTPEGSHVATAINVNASGKDEEGGSGLKELRLEILDGNLTEVGSKNSTTGNIQETFSLPPGAYLIKLFGEDNAGNPNSTERNVTLYSNPLGDNTPPELWFGPNATRSAIYNQSWINLDIRAADNGTDASGLEKILVNVTEVDGKAEPERFEAGDHLVHNLTVEPGIYEVKTAAHDKAGNVRFGETQLIVIRRDAEDLNGTIDNCTDNDTTNDIDCPDTNTTTNGTDEPADPTWWDENGKYVKGGIAIATLGAGYFIYRKVKGRRGARAPVAPAAPVAPTAPAAPATGGGRNISPTLLDEI